MEADCGADTDSGALIQHTRYNFNIKYQKAQVLLNLIDTCGTGCYMIVKKLLRNAEVLYACYNNDKTGLYGGTICVCGY